MSKLADGRLGRCHRFRDLCRGKDVMGTAALDPSYGFRGPKMRRAARSAALPDPSRVSGVQRIRLVGIDLVKLEDRKSVVWGKGVSVRVDTGGCRSIKKK